MENIMKLNDIQLKRKLAKMHHFDIANLIKDAEKETKLRVIKQLSLAKSVDVFLELPKEASKEYFYLLSENQKKQFLNEFEMDELKNFITSFDDDYQNYLMGLLGQRKKTTIKLLLSYDDESIASIMTTEFVTIEETSTIKQATSYVIKTSKDNDFVDDIFVINKQGLVGSVSLKDLISARANDNLEDITYQINEYLTLEDSIYQGFKKFRSYGKNVMPVLNNVQQIVGIVTADDVFKEIIEDYEEDIERLTAVGDYDEDSKASKRAIQRLPWLLVSVILNLVIAVILSVFERTLIEVVALILFQPMILGMAGNIGTQSISVTILKINHDELVDKKALTKHISKEIGIGFLNSALIGIAGFIVAFLVMTLLTIGNQSPLDLATTIGTSLFGGMFISAIAGVFIPITLDKLKIDPTIASGPIISTLNDLIALLVYFGIATIMFML